MNNDLKEKASEALLFLSYHPALGCCGEEDILRNLHMYLAPVSKEGRIKNEYDSPETMTVSVYTTDPRAKELVNFTDDEPDEIDWSDPLDSFSVPYTTYYGKPWVLDKYKYFGEINFYRYHERITDDRMPYMNQKNWMAYHGISLTADTFEQLVIRLARYAKKFFGDFNHTSFFTDKELENHENEWPIMVDEEPNENGHYGVTFNENYIDVHAGIRNERWWDWFKTTNYCKKYWSNEI